MLQIMAEHISKLEEKIDQNKNLSLDQSKGIQPSVGPSLPINSSHKHSPFQPFPKINYTPSGVEVFSSLLS